MDVQIVHTVFVGLTSAVDTGVVVLGTAHDIEVVVLDSVRTVVVVLGTDVGCQDTLVVVAGTGAVVPRGVLQQSDPSQQRCSN